MGPDSDEATGRAVEMPHRVDTEPWVLAVTGLPDPVTVTIGRFGATGIGEACM